MTARTGMSDLITELRSMADAGTADYTVGSTAYWTDDQLQTVLDRFRTDVQREELTQRISYIGGGTIAYYEYRSRFANWESGTAALEIENSIGDTQGTANYSGDYTRGVFTFAADTKGTAYFATGRVYDLNAAAAHVWRRKAAHTAGLYSFSTDGHRFDRSQWHANCIEMANYYSGQARPTTINVSRGDLPGCDNADD